MIVENEGVIRLGAYVLLTLSLFSLEVLIPRRRFRRSRARRAFANIGITAINTLAVRLILPASAVGFAFFAASNNLGLFNSIAIPAWVNVALTIVILDVVIYGQHVAFHKIPILWRLHKMHHTDEDLDVTSGTRFHTIEILLSMGIKGVAIIALGSSALGVVLFEVLLNATSIFTHANVRLPKSIDKALRTVIVTPDMHRVHHSVYREETQSNYAFNLSIWDRMFRTYTNQPKDGHKKMKLGIEHWNKPKDTATIRALLTTPFVRK